MQLVVRFLLVFFVSLFISVQPILAQTGPAFSAKITKVTQISSTSQQVEATIFSPIEHQGQTVSVTVNNEFVANPVFYQVGDRVLITPTVNAAGQNIYQITDFIRTDSLLVLALIFVGLTIFIARLKGITSVLSLIFSFLLILHFILPKIIAGSNPIIIALLTSLIIIPVTFYLSHGFNKKTSAAVISSWITLVITGIMTVIFTSWGHLTGYSSEEANTLAVFFQGALDMKGLLLAGFIIGTLGILDDITISQSAIVEELAQDNHLSFQKLYAKAMNVGRDHISSNVNTLILVYAGVSLPLLLIFFDNSHPFIEIINYEFIAEEIIRTLVGSIGLVLAVPISTFIAAWFYQTSKTKNAKIE